MVSVAIAICQSNLCNACSPLAECKILRHHERSHGSRNYTWRLLARGCIIRRDSTERLIASPLPILLRRAGEAGKQLTELFQSARSYGQYTFERSWRTACSSGTITSTRVQSPESRVQSPVQGPVHVLYYAISCHVQSSPVQSSPESSPCFPTGPLLENVCGMSACVTASVDGK
ncbi:uncharacterized protein [Montipora capricornis]|uniref:uncharacterized protein n=1 Tax=Montipora capricornis TaxID=246305 RepID=UPI0035F1962A